ncbi:AP2-like ethylene-responsive transcription factor AIL6 [Heracleum sosnowskyi]|uniref:AP2-like ethylene-responsive transcription factor AIL6 n=1 Tax=Heracleum sosnowskyi TaxID=360622 RepID=A0AAD8IW07_9APIA|nr:AP2-like ethylene-responsive transcription factor AIL6 [Heracleum sosnowskyi]
MDYSFSSSGGWKNLMAEENQEFEEKMKAGEGHYMFTNFETHAAAAHKPEDYLNMSLYDHSFSVTKTESPHPLDPSSLALSQVYNTHSDVNMVTPLQAFSANSGFLDSPSQLHFGGQSNESGNELLVYNYQDSEKAATGGKEVDNRKKIVSNDTFGHRTSIYRGVTRHRWTGRYEAHLWDNSCIREGQARKGRQVYLGGYEKEDKAAIAYDLAALKYWGPTATTNFPVSNYTKEVEMMKNFSNQEFIASLRRKSSGFSRGASIYRGVTRHHQQGRWQARIGRVAGNKDLYLGTFATEEEAAEAYDIAAIKFRGANAVTNFELNRYDVEAIAKSSLPIGASKRVKLSLEAESKPSYGDNLEQQSISNSGSNISFDATRPVSANCYEVPFNSTTPLYHHNLLQLHSRNAGTSDASDSMSAAVTSEQVLAEPAEFFLWPHCANVAMCASLIHSSLFEEGINLTQETRQGAKNNYIDGNINKETEPLLINPVPNCSDPGDLNLTSILLHSEKEQGIYICET